MTLTTPCHHLCQEALGVTLTFGCPFRNLLPLGNPFEEHIEDELRRQIQRTGMLLTSDELTGFVHLPSSAIRSPVFQRRTSKAKAALAIARQHGLLPGNKDHAGETVEVRLSAE
jgi:hypothetical protein